MSQLRHFPISNWTSYSPAFCLHSHSSRKKKTHLCSLTCMVINVLIMIFPSNLLPCYLGDVCWNNTAGPRGNECNSTPSPGSHLMERESLSPFVYTRGFMPAQWACAIIYCLCSTCILKLKVLTGWKRDAASVADKQSHEKKKSPRESHLPLSSCFVWFFRGYSFYKYEIRSARASRSRGGPVPPQATVFFKAFSLGEPAQEHKLETRHVGGTPWRGRGGNELRFFFFKIGGWNSGDSEETEGVIKCGK